MCKSYVHGFVSQVKDGKQLEKSTDRGTAKWMRLSPHSETQHYRGKTQTS